MALFDPTQDGAPLALLTLGVVGDARPLPALQPALPEGIHLRWAFARDSSNSANNLGFPWYGFYLFRRPTLTSGATTTCAASQFTGLTPGPRSSPDLTVPLGTFHSDQNLVLTENFPPTGTVELDLSGRSFVNFQMNPTLPNRSVDVKIGFIADFPAAGGGPGTTGGGGPPSGGLGGNAATTGICGCGCAHDAIRPVVEQVVAIGPGQYRATFGYDNEGMASISMAVGAENRFFPEPASRGQPTLFLAGRRTDVFSVVFDGRQLTWRLAGNSVTVSAADAQAGTGGGTGGTGTGTGTAAGIVVTAFNNGSAVATRVVAGHAGDLVTVSIAFEGIDAIRVTSGPARLVDVCATRTTDGIGQGWAPVPNFPQPMLLPVRHNSYPLQQGTPDIADSESRALPRIRYGFPSAQDPTKVDTSEWTAGTAFSDLFATLVKIVQGGPPGITDFLENVPASADPSDPDTLPQSTQQSSLDLLLGAAINPAMAQMLGLYWIDDQTVEGQSYDYTLVADYNNAGAGNVSTILGLVTAGNYANITGYQRIGVVRAVTPPPAPPQNPAAYSLPVGGVPANAPGDVAGQVGLRWDIPTMSDTNLRIRSDAPILFHVWRKDFGLTLPTSGDASSEFQRITDLPLSAGLARTQSPDPPLQGWPSVGLFAIDGPLVEGWYAYRVSGIDIFGRYGDLSGSTPWVNAGTIQVGDPNRAVHLMDTMPPPAPTGVLAWLLDPGDPFVIQDGAYNAWRTPTPPVSGRATTIGLRVRWLWTGKQMRQAPDTKEFRIYLKAGSSMQHAGLVTSWDRRVAAVAIGEQVLSEVLVPAVTAAPVSLAGLEATAAGNVVTLADGAPLDQIDPTGGLELELDDATGGRTRFTVQAIDPAARAVTVAQTPVLAGVSAWTLGPAQLQGQSATVAGAVITLTDAPPLARLTLDALELDLPAASGGRTRFTVLQMDSVHGTVTLDAAPVLTATSAWTLGVVERTYEVFLPGAPLAAPLDFVLPASPSDGTPVVYALVGVSAADDKTNERAVDIFAAQQAATVLVPRPGNEGAVGGPMTIVQVLRTTPAPPTMQFPQPTLSATRADFNSRSFFNLHFPRAQDLFTHVYRAVDEMVFQVDGSKRFPPATPPTPPSASPTSSVSAADLGWDPNSNRFNTAASAIAALTSTDGYAGLSPDALRLLASLPSNAEAFSCLTAAPLDPATPDAVGANDDGGYQVAPNLSAYQDTLDGRASNVYFYRTAKVNRAHTPGSLSVSTPPVLLPPSAPPTAPVLVDAGAGSNSIHLSWQSSLDPTVSEYRIYSAATAERIAALQNGDVLSKVTETRTPDQRPLVIASGDLTVTGGQRLFVAVTAAATTPTDPAGRESGPSRIVALKAFDDSRPTAPAWNPPQPQTGGAVLLSWTTSDPTLLRFMVQRRRAPDTDWTNVSSWLASDVRQFLDSTRAPGGPYDYRLIVLDNRGRQNNVFSTVTA